MALKPIYTAPAPKLPAYANVGIRDFNTPQLSSPSTGAGMIGDFRRSPNMNFSSRMGLNLKGQQGGVKPSITEFGAAPAALITKQPAAAPAAVPATSNGFASRVGAIAPYASNIANLFSKPGLPPAPTTMDPISLERVSMDAERAKAEQLGRGIDVASDRNLDGNNATAAKIAGYSQRIKAFSDISGTERNANAEITNRETQLNMQIKARNNAGKDQYGRDLVERDNVIKSNRSENFANMSDKFIEGKNQKALQQLDADKLKVLSKMSPDIWGRLLEKLKKEGYDPTAAK